MKVDDREQDKWMEIARRVKAGEKQTVIAQELGMEVTKFRYRLRKFQGNFRSDSVSSPNQSNLDSEAESSLTQGTCNNEVEPSSIDTHLFDESWNRQWLVSRLVLLVKEPQVLFAYWEVDEQKRRLVSKHFETGWDHLPFYLQLYDITDIDFDGFNAHRTERIQVHPYADNWYVNGIKPQRSNVMDFGTTTLRGDFFTILRSNVVQTPPQPSNRSMQDGVWFAPLAKTSVEQSPILAAEDALNTKETVTIAAGVRRPYPREFDGYSVRAGRN
ncbi:DUF4912 domain-containing protein [Alicyclobacillus fastidiosus]|uniref:DUF4912 domain-containing protein n=1 Tax=Alicyclobacillus fastidiosus TaxID=392011 RepID=A0ABY6ZLW1_9BACL|nr:DUF4912 domain-containing protein [Alicyclobacillus fastidiosus]WAH43094.1 DUF4912 domain-containing protein [Alicyclobacillus fastidiosus]GMA65092.1 hypothetical protein GCM10025859_55320 [Alicyclobacillus fastidiosus]